MLITKRSQLSGIEHTLDIPVKAEDMNKWIEGKGKIQEIFYYLSPDQREFIMTGITKEEWDKTFKEEE